MTQLPLDPSSLLALSCLLSERHVTRAAKKFGITQSSMSHRLKDLRAAFGDELLVRDGRQMVLTPMAENIRLPLERALLDLAHAVTPKRPFNPKEARFAARLALPDLLAPFLPELTVRLARSAPHLRLEIAPILGNPNDFARKEERGLVIAPTRFAEDDMKLLSLGKMEFGVVVRKGHPLSKKNLTLKRWLTSPQVVVGIGHPAHNQITSALQERNLTRDVRLTVPSFLSAFVAVADSDLVMNAPLPLAQSVTERLNLIALPLPLKMPPISLGLFWHRRLQNDAAHSWWRKEVLNYFSTALDKGSCIR